MSKEREELLDEVKASAQSVVEKALEGVATKEEVKAFNELIGKAATKEEVEKVSEMIEEIGLKFEKMSEKTHIKEDSLGEYLESKSDDIDKFFKKELQGITTEVSVHKAMGTANSLTGSTDVPALEVDYMSGIARTPDIREDFNILRIVNVGSTNKEIVSWMEEESETGAALFIDECVQKPEVSKTWIRKQTQVRKIADFACICDELLIYAPALRQEIERFVRKLVYIGIQDAILNGDGTGENLLGIIPQATAFVAGTKAASVPLANCQDAIAAVAAQVNCFGCRANYALVNCDDMFKFSVTKTTQGNYIQPSMGGVTPIECPFIVPGEFLVGDFRKVFVKFLKPIISEWGRNGEDFRKNSVSIRSEAFLSMHIPTNLVNGFVHETFLNVVALINKP